MYPRSGVVRAAGTLELAVYRVVAAAGPQGVTAAEVGAELDPSPAHTTAVTTLRRLLLRGVLAHHRVGRMVRYTTTAGSGAVTATATARRLHHLFAAAPDPDRVLAAFVTGLPAGDTEVPPVARTPG